MGRARWSSLAVACALVGCATTEPLQTTSKAERPDVNVGPEECAIDTAALVFARSRLHVAPGAVLGVESREDQWMGCRVVQDARACTSPGPRAPGHSLRGCGWESAPGTVLLEPSQVDELAHAADDGADPRSAVQAVGITSGEVLGLGRAFRGADGSALLDVECLSGQAFQLQMRKSSDGRWGVASATDVD